MTDVPRTQESPHRVRRRRQVRTVAHTDAASLRLTERDTWILDALTRMRFLTTTLLSLLFFAGSRDAANKRLRRLLDGGYVKAWVVSLARDNVYSLTRRGFAALGATAEHAPASTPRSLDGNLDHLLAINTVRVALARTLAGAAEGELVWWRSDWELRTHRGQRTIPDALFAVAWPDGAERVFALEVEHHTRAPRSFQAKLLRYASASYRPGSLLGQTSPVVLVVGLSPTWLARYRAALAALPLPLAVGCATLGDIERAGAGAVWRSPTIDTPLSLRTLATLPYRTEGWTRETPDTSGACATGVAHKSPSSSASEPR